tara:strand:+ start:2391 stop:3893 length:1503 start_codon:yes stop_codon:yes gene_type:complete
MIKKIIILIFIFSFYGCSTYSSSKLSKRIITNEDDKWESIEFNQNQNQDLITSKWWTIFKDSKLDLIMEVFLSNNYDLKLAISSLESSKQLAVYNAGKLLPDINAQINNQRAEQYLYFDKERIKEGIEDNLPEDISNEISDEDWEQLGEQIGSIDPSYTNTYGLNLTSQWEIDAWGKLYSKRISAKKEYEASKNEYKFLQFSLISQAVKIYFNLVESKEQLALADSSLSAYKDIFNIVEQRYNQGVRSSLDYRLAKSNLLIAEASLERRRMVVDNLTREMEVLLGFYPSGLLETSNNLSISLPSIPNNLPSEIIQRRPDIIATYNKVESSFSDLDYAKKMKFPSFNITGSMGTSTDDLSKLLDGDFSVWSLGANITLPIFQSGKIKAYKNLSQSVLEQAEIQYIYSILKAFSEIENKLSMDKMLNSQLVSLREAYIQSKEAYLLAKDRYDKGLTNLITVLDSQKRMFDTDSQMISIQKLLIDNRIDLLICLGGGLDEFEG